MHYLKIIIVDTNIMSTDPAIVFTKCVLSIIIVEQRRKYVQDRRADGRLEGTNGHNRTDAAADPE